MTQKESKYFSLKLKFSPDDILCSQLSKEGSGIQYPCCCVGTIWSHVHTCWAFIMIGAFSVNQYTTPDMHTKRTITITIGLREVIAATSGPLWFGRICKEFIFHQKISTLFLQGSRFTLYLQEFWSKHTQLNQIKVGISFVQNLIKRTRLCGIRG